MQVHTLVSSPQRQSMHHVHTHVNREDSPPWYWLRKQRGNGIPKGPRYSHHSDYLGTTPPAAPNFTCIILHKEFRNVYYTQNINGLNTPRVSRSRGRDKCLLQSLLLSLLLMLIILNTSKYFYSVAPPSSCTMGELEKLSHYNFEEYQCLDGARGGVVVKTAGVPNRGPTWRRHLRLPTHVSLQSSGAAVRGRNYDLHLHVLCSPCAIQRGSRVLYQPPFLHCVLCSRTRWSVAAGVSASFG